MKMMKMIIVVVCLTMLHTLHVYADEPQLEMARCTTYILQGTCADGSQTRKGICAAPTDKVPLGSTIAIYLRDYQNGNTLSEFVGFFEVTDHCPEGNIDIWAEDMESAKEIMKVLYYGNDGTKRCDGRIFYQVINAKG